MTWRALTEPDEGVAAVTWRALTEHEREAYTAALYEWRLLVLRRYPAARDALAAFKALGQPVTVQA